MRLRDLCSVTLKSLCNLEIQKGTVEYNSPFRGNVNAITFNIKEFSRNSGVLVEQNLALHVMDFADKAKEIVDGAKIMSIEVIPVFVTTSGGLEVLAEVKLSYNEDSQFEERDEAFINHCLKSFVAESVFPYNKDIRDDIVANLLNKS